MSAWTEHAAHDRRGFGCLSAHRCRLWEAFRFLRERGRALRGRANLIFWENGTRVAIALGLWSAPRFWLRVWSPIEPISRNGRSRPHSYKVYHGEWADVAQVLNAQPSAANMVYLLPYRFNEHYGFEYLYHGATPAYVIRANMPDLAQKVESTLTAMEKVSTVKVVDWNDDFVWTGDGDEHLVDLLDKFGRYLVSEEFSNFQIHTYTDLSLERPWTFYEELELLTVHYDGGIDLRGLAWAGGGAAVIAATVQSGRGSFSVGGLQWQTGPGLDSDYAISLRLYNAGGEDPTRRCCLGESARCAYSPLVGG